jgi:asparagine synthetase B (glutamine-hydrolysing)
MCSFLFSTNIVDNIEKINHYLKFRGPDHTEVKHINNHLFVHNLLSITGKFTPQPYTKDDIALVYNGEIYNFKEFGDYQTDGECLIPLYEKHGPEFTKQLDGEFALCLVDYKKQQVIISSDVFKTKPVFFGVSEDHFGCATYKTPLQELNFKQIYSCEPNTTYVFDLQTKELKAKTTVYDFDLTQHKTSYDDWIKAFKQSIKKRLANTNKNIFIGLSSGYDSGAIYNELIESNQSFHSYTLTGTENDDVIAERLKLNRNNCCTSKLIPKTDKDFNFSHLIIRTRTEPFMYTIKSDIGDYSEPNRLLIEDEGSNNLATVCRLAKRDNCKICLSGSGADEIISDYGFNGERFFNHSNFGGKFPEELSDIFPWSSFYHSTMESYLAKEEYVGGSYGIEMRYPFLDKTVVQEFLWLTSELKNKAYKAPLDYYFNLIDFPYERNRKRGF